MSDTSEDRSGELTGKPVGPGVDKSFHYEEFTNPQTGEVIETEHTVHDDSGYAEGTGPGASPSEE